MEFLWSKGEMGEVKGRKLTPCLRNLLDIDAYGRGFEDF